jgi:spermidine synthase
MKNYRKIFIFIGFGSTIAQITLLREFMVVFYGNELSIGIILFSWLFWIGLGSSLGDQINHRIKNHEKLFLFLAVALPVIMFFQVLLIKFARYFLDTPAGEYISILELIYFSFIVLGLGCLLWGILFTIGAYISSHGTEKKWIGVNRVYIYETLGSVFGGLLFSFLLVSFLTSFQIVLFLLVLSIVLVILRLYFSDESASNNKRAFSSTRTSKIISCLMIVVLIIIFMLLFSPLKTLEKEANKIQWSYANSNFHFIDSKNTKYQNLAVLEHNDQYTVFSDGKPFYNIPNTYNAEILVHSIMIHSENPKSILLIGGGFNGIINEILKYNVNIIDYVEIDPELIEFAKNYLPVREKQNLTDPKVRIIEGDGRDYIKNTNRIYDLIILNTGEPSTTGLNRYYTIEFYNECYSKLSAEGIMAFSFTSSADYFGEDLKNLNASFYSTFKKVFSNLVVVPGTTAILIGSKSSLPLTSDANILAKRYVDRNIKSEYFSEFIYEQIMPKDRVDFFISTMEGVRDPRINYDMNPVTYFYEMILWNKFLRGKENILDFVFKLNKYILLLIVISPLLIIYLINIKNSDKRNRVTALNIMFVGGMVGIIFSLIIMLNFQTIFGSIYEMVGSMIAANMLGLCLGSLAVSRFDKERHNILLPAVIITGIIFSLLLPQVLELLISIRLIEASYLIMILYGCITGCLFASVNRSYLIMSNKLGKVYSWDVFGSSIGSLIASSILIPCFGISNACLLLALLLVFSLITILVNKSLAG